MKRRDALKSIGALTTTAYASKWLSACGDNAKGGGKIDTIVYMMMENRSYDHYLGSRKLLEGLAGDGLTSSLSNPNLDGQDIGVFPMADGNLAQCVAADPPHDWDASRVQFAAGANNGFLLAHEGRHGSGLVEPMSYMQRSQIPVTHALADAYTSCDRWFSSLLCGTLPNRMYWHAGTSNGAKVNGEVLEGAFEGVRSIHHELSDAGIDWAYYFGDVPVIGVLEDIDLNGYLRRFYNDFLTDAAAGTLPSVCYIDPSFSANDDHPPHHPLLGQQLIAATYQALATSPQWENCMLVVTYDEAGGFYDHVAPPTAADERADQGFGQMGFRVPTLVAGPYAKQNYVSSVQYDHSSALKHLQNRFALPSMGTRVDAANDLSDCIDFDRLDAGQPAAPITLPGIEIDESQLPMSCTGASLREYRNEHEILQWADANQAKLGPWDRRKFTQDDIYGISEYLDHHNLGRIRRGR